MHRFGDRRLVEDFSRIAEVVLGDGRCGRTLCREGSLSPEVELDFDSFESIDDDEIYKVDGTFDTIIYISPYRHNPEHPGHPEINWFDKAISMLRPGGRLFFAVRDNFLTAPYASSQRKEVMLHRSLSMVVSTIEGDRSRRAPTGCYYLLVENKQQINSVPYYTGLDLESTLANILKAEPTFKAKPSDLAGRWDKTFQDPRFNEDRKKYLSKDTVRLSGLAYVYGSAPGIKNLERRPSGEYRILRARNIIDGEVANHGASEYCDRIEEPWFLDSVLRDGDILVTALGGIRFAVYSLSMGNAIAGNGIYVVRPRRGAEGILQLYFSTKFGEEDFNRQASMLGTGPSGRNLSRRDLESFVVPNEQTLRNALSIQSEKSLEERAATLFFKAGWDIERQYKFADMPQKRYDLALLLDGRAVGIVETKSFSELTGEIKNHMAAQTSSAFMHGVEFAILFTSEAMYAYNGNSFGRLFEIPAPDNYRSTIEPYDADGECSLHGFGNDGTEVDVSGEYLIRSITQPNDPEKIDEILSVVKRIEAKLDALSSQIADYQDIVGALLKGEQDDQKKDEILKTLADQCAEKASEAVRSEYNAAAYESEKNKLLGTFGRSAWDKLASNSQNFLVSAKLTYNNLSSVFDAVDYSGVCLLVTKALELELYRRFCCDYIEDYRKSHPGRQGTENAPSPLRYRMGHKYLRENDFTLGTFAYIVGEKIANDERASDPEFITSSVVDFAKKHVMITYAGLHNDEEILDLLQDYADEVETVRQHYRNPAAHTNGLKKVDAEGCFDLVIDVQRLLKRMLDTFDY